MQQLNSAWKLALRWLVFLYASAKLALKDKALFYQACSTLIAHTQARPDICRAYSHCVKPFRVGTITNIRNLSSYLALTQPVRSSSLEIVRIGGIGDGGYCMLPPPPSKI